MVDWKTTMKTIKVLLFANLRTKLEQKELRIDIDTDATVDDLLAYLVAEYPVLRPHLTEKIVISINHKIADRGDIIPSGAEVALLPPVGGG